MWARPAQGMGLSHATSNVQLGGFSGACNTSGHQQPPSCHSVTNRTRLQGECLHHPPLVHVGERVN